MPKDTLVVFTGTEFLYLDHKADSWAVGDIEAVSGQPLEIAENASIVRVDDRCANATLFVTGGVLQSGAVLNWAYGLSFEKDKDGLLAYMTTSDP